MKRVHFQVTLNEDEAKVFRDWLTKHNISGITDMVRRILKMPAKHPRPCKAYHESKLQVHMQGSADTSEDQ